MITILLQEIRDLLATFEQYLMELPFIRKFIEFMAGLFQGLVDDVHEIKLYMIDTFKELFTSLHTHVANIQEELHNFREEQHNQMVELIEGVKVHLINKLNELKEVLSNIDTNITNIRTNVLSARINTDTIATETVTIREKESSIESYMNSLTQGATRAGESGEKTATNTLGILNHIVVIDSTATAAKDDLDGLLLKVDDTNNLLVQILAELKKQNETTDTTEGDVTNE